MIGLFERFGHFAGGAGRKPPARDAIAFFVVVETPRWGVSPKIMARYEHLPIYKAAIPRYGACGTSSGESGEIQWLGRSVGSSPL